MKKLGVFIPILLTIVLAFSIIPSVFAEIELKYDDGESDGCDTSFVGNYLAVKFSLPTDWNNARILKARYYFVVDSGNFKVHIFDSDGITELLDPPLALGSIPGWFEVDVSTNNIIVTGDFYIAIEFIESAVGPPCIGFDSDSPLGPSFTGTPGFWGDFNTGRNIMIRAVVEQANPVGGVFYSADKVGLLSPWIATISIIGCIAIISLIAKKRRA